MEHWKTIEIVEKSQRGVYVAHERFERRYDFHQHSKGQLSYVEDGIAYLTIDKQHYIVPARYFFWIPAGVLHKLKVSHSATQIHSLYFSEELNPGTAFYNTFGIYPATDLIVAILKFSERWRDVTVTEETTHYSLIISLYALIAEQQQNTLTLVLPDSEEERMRKVIQYVEQHLHTNITIKQMTDQFNMSERTFTRWFKRELGVSFVQYLKTVRMVKAMELLLKTHLSIAEIANNVGYDSLPTFSNLFVSYTGRRPNEMRKHFDSTAKE